MEKILLDELSNIISAYKEGRTLQFYTSYGGFKDVSAEEFDIEKWYKKPKKFRIKSEPKYRPFKDAKECWAEMQKHQPIGWLTSQNGEVKNLITLVDNTGIVVGDRNNSVMGFFTATDLFKIKFADGIPFGVKVEE